jgi:prepilin-type N-terminal cleavage/methylation domain-containing protein
VRGQAGFTLVEMLIVVLIVGIIIAVAAPSFLGQTQKAEDSVAKQYLALTYRAAKAEAASNDGTYPADLLTRLRQSEPQTTFDTGTTCTDATASGNHVLFDTNSNGPASYVAYTHSKSGKTFRLVGGASSGMQIDTVCDASGTSGSGSPSSGSPLPSGPPPDVTTPSSGSPNQPQVGVPITVDPGAWTSPDGNPVDVSEQWQRCDADGTNCADIAGATGLTYTPVPADVGKSIRVVITGSGDGGTTSVDSDSLGPVLPAKPELTGQKPTVSDSNAATAPEEGSELSGTDGDWAQATQTPTSYTYQWQRSADGTTWTAIAGANQSTYTPQPADVGDQLRLCVTAFNDGGQTTSCSDATDPVTPLPPRNSVLPSLTVSSGATINGETVTAQKGTWLSAVAVNYTYQWQRSADTTTWTDISGATGAAYQLTDADYDQSVRVQVTATNSAGALTKSSAALGPVTDHLPAVTSAPTIAGATVVTATLTASHGAWSSATAPTYTYQWQFNDGSGFANLPGETTTTYTTVPADVGHTLRIRVTATNSAGSQTTLSDPTAAITEPVPANTAAPTVSGVAQEGALLSASTGSWSSATTPAYSYQWQSNDGSGFSDLAGATSVTYTVRTQDIDNRLRVRVTATNSAGPASQDSAQTAAVVPAPATSTAPPTITGQVREGQTVTATNGTWASSRTVSYTYQWLSCNASGLACTAISGETAQSYVVRAQDIDQTLEVQVTAANGGGQTSAVSAPSTIASAASPQSTALPTVSGTAVEGQTLTVSNGSWTSSRAVTYTYQWQYSSGGPYVDLLGETGSSYLVKDTDVGLSFRARVTATNTGGSASATSGAVGPVTALAPANTTAPSISGSAREDQLLTGDKGTWHSAVSVSYGYQWRRCDSGGANCVDVPAATSLTYTVQAADVSGTLRFKVTATNSTGAASVSSNPTATVLQTVPASTSQPQITGAAQESQTLTTSTGGWAHSAATYTYQWQRSTTTGGVWNDIPGATLSSYVLQSSEVGFSVHVLVSACNSAGCSDPVTSAQSGVVQALAPQNTVAPSVSGTYQDGQTLTASTGTWSSSQPITGYDYQWLRCVSSGSTCVAIGSNQSTYTLQTADVGSRIIVGVDATNIGGTSAMVYSSSQSGSAGAAGQPAAVTSAVPLGAVVPYAGTTIPTGWALADGAAVSRGTYSELFALEGTNYGAGNGSTTFNLPNLQGRTALGLAATGSTLGATGGSLDYGGGPVTLAAPSFSFNVPASGTVNVNGLADHTHTWDPGHNTFNCCGASWSYTYSVNNLQAAGGTSTGWATINEATQNGLAPVSTPQPTGTVSAANAPYTTVRYIVKVLSTGGAPDCALWGYAGATAPAATSWARGQAASGTLTSCLASGFSGNLPDLQGRLPLGQALSGTGATLGSSGGALDHSHSLTVAAQTYNVAVSSWSFTITPPSHNHSLASASGYWGDCQSGPCYGGINGNQWSGASAASASPAASASYAPGTLTTAPAGGQTVTSAATSNPPYLAVNYLAHTNASYSLAAGTLTPYVGPVAPSGWLIADGSCLATSTYPSLFITIGYTYGGSGGSFCLPDLQSRFPLGKAASGTASALGSVGGTLSEASSFTVAAWQPTFTIPAHSYSWSIGNHSHTVRIGGNPGVSGQVGGSITNLAGTCYNCDPSSSAAGGQTVTSQTVSARTVTATTASGAQTVSGPAGTTAYQVLNYLVFVGSASSADSAAGAPSNSAAPTVTGTAKNGQTLVGTTGTWANATNYYLQWQRCNAAGASCNDINGATDLNYTMTSADLGKTLRLFVLAANSAGTTNVNSAPTAVVQPLDASTNSAAPTVSGSAQVGQTLASTSGTWTPTPASYSYQWQRCTAPGSGCADISGATASSYVLQTADATLYMRSQVTSTNADGVVSSAAFSAATSSVIYQPPANTATPVVSGTTVSGQTMSTTNGSWTGQAPLTYTYQWQRCNSSGTGCANIAGATSSSYILTTAEIGGTVVAVVTGTNSAGGVSQASSPSAVVNTLAASGGAVSTASGAKIHIFTSSGTFTVSAGSTTVTLLLVAGGGGGGNSPDRTGGGGGGGGVVSTTCTVAAGSYSVSVGGGGGALGNGGNSVFSGGACGLTAIGGGHGGDNSSHATSGGSGGGRYHNAVDSAGAGTSGQGFGGGPSGYDSGSVCNGFYASGGGGAGGTGQNATSGGAGAGGVGYFSTITGSGNYYGDGGGGGAQCANVGGSGGGWNGGHGSNNGSGVTSGNASTGAGGGGGGNGQGGGSGGSGIIVISYNYP